LLVKDLGR